MKKIVLILFSMICFTSYNSKAQTYSFSPGDTFIVNQGLNDMTFGGIEWTNNSSQILNLHWKTIEFDTISGSEMDFCASAFCFLGLPDTGSSYIYPTMPGQVGWFKFHFWSGSVSGTSKARIYVYEPSNPNGGDTLTYIFNMNALNGIAENTNDIISFYPNPATDKINFTIKNKLNNYKVSIINSLGQLMNDYEINFYNYQIDVSALKPQTYFIVIKDEQNKIIQKSKIIKTK